MSLRQDLRYAWRSLRHAPVFSASVILTLTIGIGSAAAIFAIVNAVLIRPLTYGNSERLVGAWFDMTALSLNHAPQTSGTYFTFKKFVHSIEGIGIYQPGSVSVTDPNGQVDPERMRVVNATASLIPLLQVHPLLGRVFTDSEDVPKGPHVAVISEGLWRSRFAGDRNVVGKTLVISGDVTQIIGVMPERFRFPDADTKLWLPLQLDPHDPSPGGFNYVGIVRLKPDVSIAAAQREFVNVLPRFPEVSPTLAPGISTQMLLDQAKPVPHLVPMRDDVVGEVSHTLWIVAAAAVLLLLVTCANVANLMLVRADGRHRELSVRAALGAGRNRVLAHFFTEAALLSVVSAVLGLGLAALGIGLLVRAGPSQIPRLAEVRVDAAVVVFTLVVAACVAIACSAIPAVRFLQADVLSGLREGGRAGTAGNHRQRARATLVAVQVAFALVVLAASALLLRSFERLRAVRPGFDPDGVATVWLTIPTQRYPNDTTMVSFWTRLAQRAAGLPGVQSVGVTSRLPLMPNGMNINPVYVEGDVASATKIPPLEIYATVDAGYFTTMRIPLIAGRTFDRLERQHGDETIVSQEVARVLFHDSTGQAALNKRFRPLPNGPLHTIIGVVGSVRDTSLSAPPIRTMYFPESLGGDTAYGQMSRTMALVARTSGDVMATTRSMQRLIREVDPTLPTFDVRSMRATADASIARLTFTMIVLGVAAAVTLILAVIGLYGVIAYIVTLRTRELGVRIALGAQPRVVAAMVTRQALTLCGAGLVVGLALVVAGGHFLRSFLYEVAPTDPLALGAATALLVGFALVASWIPARRAARVNPIEALRSD